MLNDLRTSHLTQRRCTPAAQALLTLGCVALAGTLLIAVAQGRGAGNGAVARPIATLDGPLFHELGRRAGAQGAGDPADNGVERNEENGTALQRLAVSTLVRLGSWITQGRDRATPTG